MPPAQTPPTLTLLIVRFIGAVALLGSFSLCLSMFVKTWSQDNVTTAVVSLTLGAIGTLSGILANTRSASTTTDTTMTQTTETVVKPKPAELSADVPLIVTKQPEVAIKGEENGKTNDKPPVQFPVEPLT